MRHKCNGSLYSSHGGLNLEAAETHLRTMEAYPEELGDASILTIFSSFLISPSHIGRGDANFPNCRKTKCLIKGFTRTHLITGLVHAQ
jgi:hypothetical protein